MMVVPEQPVTVLKKVPDNDHVQHQNEEHRGRVAVHQLIDFNGNEEGRFTDRHPARPAHPEGPGTTAADLYSLGKVLYEAFTGLAPNRFPDLPSDLLASPSDKGLIHMNRILLRTCETDPSRRYQIAAELRADLQALLQQVSGKTV